MASEASRETEAILLEKGRIVDGSGEESWIGDVLIVGDRIQAVGLDLRNELPSGVKKDRVGFVNCEGLVVAPGFIDAHTHDDAIVLHHPAYLAKVSQGITTVITGNCGISLVPYKTEVAQASLTLLGPGSFAYPTMAAYREAVTEAKPSLNVAALVGHTTLRYAVMDDLERAATAEERIRMAQLLDECLADGAHGLSSGLFYAEAMPAPASEVTALAHVVARHGGVYATHMRTEMDAILEAMHEASDCAFEAGIPLIISHHKCAGPSQWGRSKETLPLIDRLAERQQLAFDVYPYVAGSTVLREDLVDGVIDVMLTWSDPHPECAGRLLSDIAADWNVDQKTACLRLQPGGASYFQMNEEDVARIVSHPRAMIGSDGLPHDRHPHPRLWGTFPRVFSHYWRERKLFSLEQAVHKMTGLTARNFRIEERGVLRGGAYADICIFDSSRIADIATYADPERLSVGVVAVYVNGQLTYEEGGKILASRGRMLTRGNSSRQK
ncbi:D-aminoacylase (plasmid) [Variovorax paradoxus]|nr:D-aminoacylase [Variovorax paradoxus]